jgi:hypothetical protein
VASFWRPSTGDRAGVFVRTPFRRFGIASPVPAKPADQIAFQNSVEQLDIATNPQTQAEFLQETLSVGERVALYRHLLEDEAEINDIRRLRRAIDRATGGKHQASRERRDRIQQLNLRRAQTAGLEPEPVPTELLLETTGWKSETANGESEKTGRLIYCVRCMSERMAWKSPPI